MSYLSNVLKSNSICWTNKRLEQILESRSYFLFQKCLHSILRFLLNASTLIVGSGRTENRVKGPIITIFQTTVFNIFFSLQFGEESRQLTNTLAQQQPASGRSQDCLKYWITVSSLLDISIYDLQLLRSKQYEQNCKNDLITDCSASVLSFAS